jgi:hypothetical protein
MLMTSLVEISRPKAETNVMPARDRRGHADAGARRDLRQKQVVPVLCAEQEACL